MRKNIFLFLLIAIVSCVKDHGNYDYSNVSSYSIANMDSFYYKDANNIPLIIKPEIHNSDGSIVNDSDFTYRWEIYGVEGHNISGRTIGEDINLEYYPAKIANNVASGLGVFKCYFRATSKKSGLFVEKKFTLSVGAITYEGWLVLTENNDGNSRLDMISVRNGKEDTVVQDILSLVKSSFPMNGAPRFVDCNYVRVGYPFNGSMAVLLATENTVSYLEADSLQYSPLYGIQSISDFTFPNFKQIKYYSSYYQGIFWYNNQLLPLRYYYGYIDLPINMYNGALFNASPFVGIDNKIPVTSLPACIVYNNDIHGFLRIPNLSNAVTAVDLPNGTMFNFVDSTKNLVFMNYTKYNAGKVSAILKSINSEEYYMARFSTAGVQELYTKINFPEISSSKYFAFDPTYGYLFYVTNDNKLFEFDPVSQTNTLMNDFGADSVSLLQFTNFADENEDEDHRILASKLCVSTYKAGDKENSGKINLYTVNALNGPLTLFKSYSGVGKVSSIAYKYN